MRNEENWDMGGSEQEPAEWKAWDHEPEDDWDRDPKTAEWNSWDCDQAPDESNNRNRKRAPE